MAAPWMKFYPSDWRSDPALRMCSIAARGLWAELMCIMHEAEPYGHLLIKGARIPKAKLAILVGISDRECSALLLELEANGVMSRTEDGTIYSRRMVRDAEKSAKDKANGKLGGNPKVKGGVNPPDNGEDKAQKPEARAKSEKERAEPSGSGADAPRDYRAELFNRGLKTLANLTGKGPDACRSFVGKCLKAAGDDAVVVLGLIEDAERNQVVDPSAWIAARLKGGTGPPVRATTVYQQNRQEAQEILNDLANFAAGSSNSGQANPRLLPGDSSERPEGLRSGLGANVIDLPAGGGRASG